jgi:hypothetical protein
VKRFISIILITIIALIITGCKIRSKGHVEVAGSVSETDMSAVPPVNGNSNTSDPANVDYDLTNMNNVEVYAYVCDMVNNPLSYNGKTVKLTGEFSFFFSDADDKYYFSTFIYDPPMKNRQELIFELTNINHPANCPPPGSNITILGTFQTYTEKELLFFKLVDADIVD